MLRWSVQMSVLPSKAKQKTKRTKLVVIFLVAMKAKFITSYMTSVNDLDFFKVRMMSERSERI